MPIGGIVAGIGALAGGILGANAAGNAADQAAAASRRAADTQEHMYEQTRADLQPQRESQRYALDALLSMTGLPALTGIDSTKLRGPLPRGPSRGSLFSTAGLARRGTNYGGSGLASIGANEGVTNILNAASAQPYVNNEDFIMAAPRGNLLPFVARARGGPLAAGGRYALSEYGQPEGIFNRRGELQEVTTQPTLMEASQDGYAAPLGPAPMTNPTAPPGQINAGLPIPGSSTLENPGGQPGRYNFMTDPGYGFRFDEGARAVERSAAARGMGLSGGILKALTRYGQGVGSEEYGNVYNRISNIAGLGQTGQSLTANAGMNAANQQGGYLANMGQANAAGTLGRASAYGDTLEQLSRLYGQFGSGSSSNAGSTGGVFRP